jgi:hypothetical protein
MNSRPLLVSDEKIRVFIDSLTFEQLLDEKNRLGYAILFHSHSPCFDLVRTPINSEKQEIQEVIVYHLQYSDDGEIHSVDINYPDLRHPGEFLCEHYSFGYTKKSIDDIARIIFKKTTISEKEFNQTLFVFIQAIFNGQSKSNIFITNDKILIKNRRWFESHYPGVQLNIMSVPEASFFLDLFCKKNNRLRLLVIP